jgi:hypothetical protein
LRTDVGADNGDWLTTTRTVASAFHAASEERSTRFARLAWFASRSSPSSRRTDLEAAGVEVVPTFRAPHVALGQQRLDALVERLIRCEHRERPNAYLVSDEGGECPQRWISESI